MEYDALGAAGLGKLGGYATGESGSRASDAAGEGLKLFFFLAYPEAMVCEINDVHICPPCRLKAYLPDELQYT